MINLPRHTVPSLSGTFGIPARLMLNPKMPKEPSSPSRSNALPADPNKTKIGASLTRKWLIMNKAQCLTRYIKHLADSANFKGGTFNKQRNGLIGNRFEMPNDFIYPSVTNNNKCEISLFPKFSVFLILVKQTDKMINNNSNSLLIIKDTASKVLPNCRILLFGSRARKDNSNDSDYDFLVITRETIDIRKKRIIKSIIRKELARFKIPADILIQSEDEINSKKEITGHILKQVLREGVAI